MKNRSQTTTLSDLVDLNPFDVDIQELEQRLELAVAIPAAAAAPGDDGCNKYCTNGRDCYDCGVQCK